MKTNIKFLTILFLLLGISSCTSVKNWLDGTTSARTKAPRTALCTKDAKTMEENYIALKGFDSEGEYDNRVVSFTHEEMKNNLEYLIAQAKKNGIDEEELGFRVYFAAKKDESFNKGDLKSIVPGEKAYSTVFFVATVKGDTEDANDYTNIYEIPALNYGSSRRPPIPYKSNKVCEIHGIIH